MHHKKLAYYLARITLGVNFGIHGLVRLPKLEGFAQGILKGFEGSMLPEFLVIPFAYAIPIVELILGIMLLLGLYTQKALTASALLMIVLIAGSAFKEDWGAVSTQMVYALYIFFLIYFQENDKWSLIASKKIN
ncbi:DoxX family membrane protein [Christiangramia portivictoriae]|uniref:DoxX family membrane protein n=1 Tax=Christiangramia portivictoriae TaxID=326069 RepID=UPI0004183C09|nr:DoxX family membrane protein [Christiangramia portivictoriae]